jgi:hypothetical protein
MSIGVGFGGGSGPSSSWDMAGALYQSIGYPTGNLTLNGTRHTAVIESLSVNGLSGGSAQLLTNGNLYITRTGSQINFSRYGASGATIYEESPAGTWTNSSFGGAYYWSTVPTAPQSITFNSFNQSALSLTYAFTGPASDGGSGLTSYSAQHRSTAAGKTISAVDRTSNTVTITTSSPHGYVTGDVVQIYGLVNAVGYGINDASLNGQWTITVPQNNMLTFTLAGANITAHVPSTGLVGVYGGWTATTSVGTPFTFSSLTPGRYYQMRVYANNVRGSSQATSATPYFVLPNAPVWGTKTLNTSLTQAKPYSDYLDITGYTLSTNVTIKTGSLPTGLSLTTTQIDSNNATVTISGTPTGAVGSYTFTLEATNVGGSTTSNSYTLNLASSSTVWNSPGKGTLTNTDDTAYALRNGVAYNPSGISGIVSSGDYLYAVGASTGSYSIISGALPSGLVGANSTGTIGGSTVNIFKISGTPTVSGTFNFVIRVSLDGGATYINQSVSINVRPAGKRYPTPSSPTPLTIIKRYDASAGWVDVTIGKRYDGSNWVELGNPS